MKLNHMRYLTSAQLYNLKRLLAWLAEPLQDGEGDRSLVYDHTGKRWCARVDVITSNGPSPVYVADAAEVLDLGRLVPKVRK